MFKYFFYKIGLFLLHRLPSKLFYKFALFVSDLQYLFSFRDRKAVRKNLESILPNADNLTFLTREVFRNFGRYLIEFFQMREMVDKQFIANKVNLHNIEYLDRVLSEGKGGIIVTAHIGNWELGGVMLTTLGYPLMAIALPHKERPVNDLFNLQRETKGVRVVPTDSAIRHCIKQLKANKLVALVADRDFTANGIMMDFLGRKALIPKGSAMFSWKTQAPIIPTFLIRKEDGMFDLICHEPIYPPNQQVSMSEDEVVLGIMKRYVSVIEHMVRANPSQWLVFREFFVR